MCCSGDPKRAKTRHIRAVRGSFPLGNERGRGWGRHGHVYPFQSLSPFDLPFSSFCSVSFLFFRFFLLFSSIFFHFPFRFQRKTGRHSSRDPFCDTPRATVFSSVLIIMIGFGRRGLLEKGLFRKVHFLEILENLESLEILENPQTDCGKI